MPRLLSWTVRFPHCSASTREVTLLARLLALPGALLLLPALSACAQLQQMTGGESTDALRAPETGVCRLLTAEDLAEASNSSEPVDCTDDHTAETFAVGVFPKQVSRAADRDDPELSAHISQVCAENFVQFLGGEESAVMRSMLTWAWFRPPDEAWDEGARWYRCDVIGGGEQSEELLRLPVTAHGLLLGRPDDRWLACVHGPNVVGAAKIPCSEEHTWRAVTTVKLGDAEDAYPGGRLVQARTRDFCSESVGAWLDYPVDYDFGYTYFRSAEWKAGNRRSVCWAQTDQ